MCISTKAGKQDLRKKKKEKVDQLQTCGGAAEVTPSDDLIFMTKRTRLDIFHRCHKCTVFIFV